MGNEIKSRSFLPINDYKQEHSRQNMKNKLWLPINHLLIDQASFDGFFYQANRVFCTQLLIQI